MKKYMKKAVIAIVILAGIVSSVFFLQRDFLNVKKSAQQNSPALPTPSNTSTKTQIVDSRAGFAIFTNGTFRIFTDSKYHNRSEDVYIQAENPNSVFVKEAGVTWQKFFNTLPMSLNSECLLTGTGQEFCTGQGGSLRFYINGKEKPNALTKEIKNGDRLLVTFGNEGEEIRKQQMQRIPNPQ